MDGNTLCYGNNLNILRDDIGDESVDLIYLDPPFNSQATYNVLFRSPAGKQSEAQIEAFEDTWHWTDEAEKAFDEVMGSGNTNASEMLRAMRAFLKENDMMAYLTMMAVRLLELHRVLKPTGSLYLHCDPTASHYLKIILDGVFGALNFRNEIIWKRAFAKSLMTKRLPNNHDVLLCYGKTERTTWNDDAIHTPYDPNALDEKTASKYSHRDPDGRRYRLDNLMNPNPNRPNLTYEFLGIMRVWRWTKERMQAAYDEGLVIQPSPGSVPCFKRYLDEQKGRAFDDVWTDISLNSQAQERLPYPTQKPEPLLKRIISASSNEGDLVLDPFCGCGTAIHAAQKLRRPWIGIDITHLAISLIEKRLKGAFPGLIYEVRGTPKDLGGACALAAADKYQFQWWAGSIVNAVPYGGKKKGRDTGIDGLIYFKPDGKTTETVIVSVKGGANVDVDMIYALGHVVNREKAKIGVLITLTEPTGTMKVEAVKAGFYESPFSGKYPKLQILTIAELLAGKQPQIPLIDSTVFKKSQWEVSSQQGKLL